MALDLSSLQKAVGSLERSLRVATDRIKGAVNTDEEEVVRAGVIQHFEFTYELCWKFMKRWLEANAGGSAVDGLSMKELFRSAAERQLIGDVEAWFGYHAARNKTAHVYDEQTAAWVFESAKHFAKDAKAFLKALESKND